MTEWLIAAFAWAIVLTIVGFHVADRVRIRRIRKTL
jgi:hypothetical protein